MIEKFAIIRGEGSNEFLDLNHTSKSMNLVSLMIPKFAPSPQPRTLANFGIGTPGAVALIASANAPRSTPERCSFAAAAGG
jgi:hypothetical protein